MDKKAGYCGALFFLAYLTRFDIKYKKIPIVGIAAAGIFAVIFFATEGEFDTGRILSCMFPGVLLITLALLTGEKVGYGDGITVLVLGFLIGEFYCIVVLCLGIIMTGIYSLYRLFKKSREPIPLLPFLLTALEVVFLYV